MSVSKILSLNLMEEGREEGKGTLIRLISL